MWEGGARAQRLEPLQGASHRLDGFRHRVCHWVRLRRRAATSRQPASDVARPLLLYDDARRASAELPLCASNGTNVVVGSPARLPPSAIQVPGRRDDVLLLLDQRFDSAIVLPRPRTLALRGDELPFEGHNLEEEDIATCLRRSLTPADIASACVVRHDVARGKIEILQIEEPTTRGGDTAALSIEGNYFLRAGAYRVDKVQRRDAKVIIGACLDGDLIDRGNLSIACGANDTDVRRTILKRTDEVLGIPGVA